MRTKLCSENKPAITAYRNKDARYDDLDETSRAIHRVKPEAIMAATILVGTANRVLNIPDGVKKRYKKNEAEFQAKVLPRLMSGEQTLWEEFDWAVSKNRHGDAAKTVEKFRKLPRRPIAQTHQLG